jgi:hypothetical protein
MSGGRRTKHQVDARVVGKQDAHRLRREPRDFGQQLGAADFGHMHVGDDDVELALFELPKRLPPVGGERHLIIRVRVEKGSLDGVEDIPIVVHEQDPLQRCGCVDGPRFVVWEHESGMDQARL